MSEVDGALATAPTLAEPSSVLFADDFDSENGGNGDLNYFGLTNWNVTSGTVDLIGNGFADFLPGNGLYLDLDGTSFQAGTVESKVTIALDPGTYRLEFSLAGSQRGDPNRVDVRLGDVYSETLAPPSDAPFTTITRDIVVATATNGKLVFQSFGTDNMGFLLDNVRLLTDITEPRLFNITPNHGGNAGSVTASLGGINFPTGPTVVRLTAQGQSDIAAISAAVISATQIIATFDLTGAMPLLRDAVVTFSNQENVTLQDAFIVESGSNSQLWVDILGRSTIRPGRAQTFTIVYGNHGNSDAYGVPLWLGGLPKSVDVSLRTRLTEPSQAAGVPPIDWNEVPDFVETAEEKLVPLFLPVVPPDTTGIVNITLQSNSEQGFQLKAWLSPPLVNSLAQDSLAVTDCSLAVTEEILRIAGLIPGVSCLAATRQFILGEYIDAVHDAVHERRAGESESRVMSLTEVYVDFAVFAARCAGGELPGSTIWELGQIAIGGIEVFRDCQEPFRRLTESSIPVSVVTSRDPNDKVGSLGTGSLQYVSGEQPLRYAIYFENVETATASAQTVFIRDQLDATNLDFSKIAFGPIDFGDKQVIPPPGVTNFVADVDLRPGKNLVVQINAHLDTQTGLFTCSLTSTDPVTGEPPDDPLAGFLPPNQNPPEGEGSIVFTVMPKRNLATGTEIRNYASIVFDENTPVQTAEWFNTLDNTKPTSRVLALAANQCTNFQVSWPGSDVGSGILDYTVFVSENGGPFTVWLVNTVATFGAFTGQPGRSYSFYSVARDRTGNTEDSPTVADTATTINDTQAPVISGAIVDKPSLWPPNHKMVNVTVNYSATDNCDLSSGTTCALSVTSSEPINGTGDGDTSPDWEIVDAHQVRLRAERAGNGNGRVYRITITCTDSSANSSTRVVTVSVPKNQK